MPSPFVSGNSPPIPVSETSVAWPEGATLNNLPRPPFMTSKLPSGRASMPLALFPEADWSHSPTSGMVMKPSEAGSELPLPNGSRYISGLRELVTYTPISLATQSLMKTVSPADALGTLSIHTPRILPELASKALTSPDGPPAEKTTLDVTSYVRPTAHREDVSCVSVAGRGATSSFTMPLAVSTLKMRPLAREPAKRMLPTPAVTPSGRVSIGRSIVLG
mmetsp:Transcript_96402/g.132724  ORF Transcript_96402/g.132724 Transcript_96402/m.132724 type:complete len:220 (+) Transcript_96402:494-1153(+)